jgi:hypothetical protein
MSLSESERARIMEELPQRRAANGLGALPSEANR